MTETDLNLQTVLQLNKTDVKISLSQAFSNMTEHTRRLLCEVMVFAIVPKEGTIVMKDGEELDSWSVILNGEVEITRPNGHKEKLQMGDWLDML